MAADLHIHVFEGISESDLALFSSNTFGSKYFNPRLGFDEARNAAYDKVMSTPNVWVGEVSWLKAALSGDIDEYVPSTVYTISGLISEELPTIDDELIAKVRNAFQNGNTTQYSLAKVDEVTDFLQKYKGRKAFTVSW